MRRSTDGKARLRGESGVIVLTKILIGYDGSDEARDAVAFGASLAASCGAELALAGCFPLDAETDALLWASLQERGDALFKPVLADLGELCSETRALTGDASQALARAARELNADAIVVGSSHRGHLGRVLIGSTAGALVHEAATPVIVAPRAWRFRGRQPLHELLVADDGSSEARAAGALAEEIAGATDANVRALRITSEGDPAVALVARAEGVDLMFLGSRGYGRMLGTLLGSVATHMIRAMPCPLLIVPARAVRVDGRLAGAGAEGVGA